MINYTKNERVIICLFSVVVILVSLIKNLNTHHHKYYHPDITDVREEKPARKGPVNINTAEQEKLIGIKGIGPVLAGRIISYRNENGPFKTKKDIVKVKGIGPVRYQGIKGYITVK